MATTTRTITIPSELDPVAVLGPVDEVLRQVERAFPDLTIIVRGDRIAIMSRSKQSEPQAAQAEDVLRTIIRAAYSAPMDADTVRRLLDQQVLPNRVRQDFLEHGRQQYQGGTRTAETTTRRADEARDASQERRRPHVPGVITFALGQPVRPKTAGQIALVNAIESHTITFAIGPAGTGKTYLAVAKAVQAFQEKRIRRIVLTRPAVEAGENLGFLPGTLNEKVDPYLRPLYDALSDMLGADQLRRYMDDGTIEVAPLAYMRGRTLNDAFVILDEAQNTTEQQMKMFLTRLGFNTTMVITGDITQVDLTVPRSGLATIEHILGGIDDIAFAHLEAGDVVRHKLVGQIVAAYERHSAIAGDHSTKARREHGEMKQYGAYAAAAAYERAGRAERSEREREERAGATATTTATTAERKENAR
ncbi:PhoH family protein [Bifidobacterium amazonense]|uniref:PhoH-like protein n=1 Tax=Bifidobacterium amazonense TaxID=2809027 RepID=A0ABS9VT51_9BIFI|nr:PhoH family protein [Bifidobacterium amazonense]MCH9275266.1 PhoH family protein [Bifidobacterium amazonense]